MDGTVSPGSGTTVTTFTFTVRYESADLLPAAPLGVTATVAGRVLTLQLVSGSPTAGVWQGSTTLPAGTWTVIFAALAPSGNDPTHVGPTCVVVPAPAASAPAAAPTARPPATGGGAPNVQPPPPPLTTGGSGSGGSGTSGTAGGTGNTTDSTYDPANADDGDDERTTPAEARAERAAAVEEGSVAASRVELASGDAARTSPEPAEALSSSSARPEKDAQGDAGAADVANAVASSAGADTPAGTQVAPQGAIKLDLAALVGWLAVLILGAIVVAHAAVRRRATESQPD